MGILFAPLKRQEKNLRAYLFLTVQGFYTKWMFPSFLRDYGSYLHQALNNFTEKNNWLVTISWQDNSSKQVDLFCYDNINEWPGNPEVGSYVFKNGLWVRQNPIACGSGLIILGLEEQQRRNCNSLEEYIASPPVVYFHFN